MVAGFQLTFELVYFRLPAYYRGNTVTIMSSKYRGNETNQQNRLYTIDCQPILFAKIPHVPTAKCSGVPRVGQGG